MALIHVTRFNWLAPDEEAAFNEYYDAEVMPRILARPGVRSGARYRVVLGPECIGWEGPSRAAQYMHIFELEDDERGASAMLDAVHPVGADRPWGGRRPMLDKLIGLSATYRCMNGTMNYGAPIVYMTRYEILRYEDKEIWNRLYDSTVMPRILARPGIASGGRHVITRGPELHGWLGPERSAQYLNLFELRGEEWIDKVMPPVEQIREWTRSEPFKIGELSEVRGVYRRVSPEPRAAATPSAFWERPEMVDRYATDGFDAHLPPVLESFGAAVQGLRVLDLGCAAGRSAVYCASRGCIVDAVDASTAMVARARERLAKVVGTAEAERRVRVGRMDDLTFAADGTFPLVIALGVHHLARSREEWTRALRELARVTAPGGKVLFSVFIGGEPDAAKPVEGEPWAFDGNPAGRVVLVPDIDTLVSELARVGLRPEAPLERNRRVLGPVAEGVLVRDV